MAKQEVQFLFTGKVGNVILYRWKNTLCMRAMPHRVRQSKATRQSAKDFGKAVQLSRVLRAGLSPALPNYKDRELINKMNTAILKWLRQERAQKEISFVGLEFNPATQVDSRFKQKFSVDFERDKILVTIPRLKIPDDISAPAYTTLVHLNFAAAGCDLSDFTQTDHASWTVEIPYEDRSFASNKKDVAFRCKKGSLNIIALSLQYITEKSGHRKAVVEERWTPAAIIAATLG